MIKQAKIGDLKRQHRHVMKFVGGEISCYKNTICDCNRNILIIRFIIKFSVSNLNIYVSVA